MSKKFGVDLLIDQIIDRISPGIAAFGSHLASDDRSGDTPIERLFFASLFLSLAHCEQEYFSCLRSVPLVAFEEWKDSPDLDRQHMFISPQVEIAGWRVDFLIQVYADWSRAEQPGPMGWNKLIVECDGHEFHERTKEQAARDRDRDRQAQLLGIEIFRFTGSELWRDPLGCADQVIAWANRRV
jgi:hypothetical protein